jgi:hypothetical protein
MKRLSILAAAVLLLLSRSAGAQEISIGNFSFSLSTKILEDGSMSDFGLGYRYTNRLRASLHTRYTSTAQNEELLGVPSSLNAATENILDIFLLPLEFTIFQGNSSRLWAGIGAYYQYDQLNEKGFFNMPELETMLGLERVNAYANDFSMHLFGPLLDTGFSLSFRNFSASLSFGIVPLFFLSSSQETTIDPLITPSTATNSQSTSGAPYLYASLDCVLFRYFNLVFLYDFASLKYELIDFDDYFDWIIKENEAAVQSFKMEGSLLLPLGGMTLQLGYGFIFSSIKLSGGTEVSNNRQYIIFAAKKSGK